MTAARPREGVPFPFSIHSSFPSPPHERQTRRRRRRPKTEKGREGDGTNIRLQKPTFHPLSPQPFLLLLPPLRTARVALAASPGVSLSSQSPIATKAGSFPIGLCDHRQSFPFSFTLGPPPATIQAAAERVSECCVESVHLIPSSGEETSAGLPLPRFCVTRLLTSIFFATARPHSPPRAEQGKEKEKGALLY